MYSDDTLSQVLAPSAGHQGGRTVGDSEELHRGSEGQSDCLRSEKLYARGGQGAADGDRGRGADGRRGARWGLGADERRGVDGKRGTNRGRGARGRLGTTHIPFPSWYHPLPTPLMSCSTSYPCRLNYSLLSLLHSKNLGPLFSLN